MLGRKSSGEEGKGRVKKGIGRGIKEVGKRNYQVEKWEGGKEMKLVATSYNPVKNVSSLSSLHY